MSVASCRFPNSIRTIKLATYPCTGKLRGNVCNGFWASHSALSVMFYNWMNYMYTAGMHALLTDALIDWPHWLQVGVFLFPHLCRVYVVLQWPLLSWFIRPHSPRDSTGFLSPGRGSEGSSMRDALLTAECCHWFVHSSTMSYSSACNLVHIGDLDDSL